MGGAAGEGSAAPPKIRAGSRVTHRQTRIRVTVKAVRGPFGGFQVPAGRKLIGVDLTYENLGRLRYDDAQPHGQLTVSGGESGKQTSLIPIGGRNPCENPSLKLRR